MIMSASLQFEFCSVSCCFNHKSWEYRCGREAMKAITCEKEPDLARALDGAYDSASSARLDV